MAKFIKLATVEPTEKEPEYDSLELTEWILAVSDNGSLYILSAPNIHPSLLEDGLAAEYLFGVEEVNEKAGVYKVTANLETSEDYESGHIEFDGFSLNEFELLYLVK